MAGQAWDERPLEPFGIEIGVRLDQPLPAGFEQRLVSLFDEHKLLLFRDQQVSEDQQVRLLSLFGKVLGSQGEFREISSDGNLGSGPLTWHSDLAFTDDPFKIISLHAVEVNDGQSWTAFANGVAAMEHLPADLAEAIAGRDAVTALALIQSHRTVDHDVPDYVPQQVRPAVIPHPRTGEPTLYISDMQTARIEGLPRAESDALLAALFDELYAEDHIYRHHWNNGDLLIWDNIALQHSRCDLTGMTPRRLQRVCVADKSFFELLPQFRLDDPRIAAWGSAGTKLELN